MKNNWYRVWTAAVILMVLPGCWNQTKKTEELLTGLVIINVLDKALYDDCHIKNSVNVPFEILDEYAERIDLRAEVVIYCSNYRCSTSEYAAQKLRARGFDHVSVYEGGMAEWFQNGLPVDEGPHREAYLVKPCKKMTDDATVSEGQQESVHVISMHELAQKMGIEVRESVAA